MPRTTAARALVILRVPHGDVRGDAALRIPQHKKDVAQPAGTPAAMASATPTVATPTVASASASSATTTAGAATASTSVATTAAYVHLGHGVTETPEL